MSVHPHVRGEYHFRETPSVLVVGSSPRAWGIREDTEENRIMFRFIPTCVGNTLHDIAPGRQCTVHPHMRGEYGNLAVVVAALPGSSPHAWGIPHWSASGRWTLRFIPTCVGNTAAKKATCPWSAVHPHMRGEYPPPAARDIEAVGSSPHAWGIRRSCGWWWRWWRFIPTCVGNTYKEDNKNNGYSVHPHMRGEYLRLDMRGDVLVGSSPHAWGIRLSYIDAHIEIRFIPTCVGNTLAGPSLLSLYLVHPRMRGEYAA